MYMYTIVCLRNRRCDGWRPYRSVPVRTLERHHSAETEQDTTEVALPQELTGSNLERDSLRCEGKVFKLLSRII